MKERKQIFRSGVVLLELMAAILIFALAGAVCVQVLVKADAMATEARNLSDGVSHASSAAEILWSSDTHEEGTKLLQAAWPQTEVGETIAVPFENGMLLIEEQTEEELRAYDIRWMVSGEECYNLRVVCADREVAS